MLREGRGWGSFGASYGLGKQKGEENPPEKSSKESLAGGLTCFQFSCCFSFSKRLYSRRS